MPKVLALMAHPDDIELTCAGTLALLSAAGWQVHMATMTAGDLGSSTLPREDIARVRLCEAQASAALLGAAYSCLGFDDLTIVYDVPSKRRVSLLLREVQPDVVIAPSPLDYMADHEETARLVREAAFASTMPNWRTFGNGFDPPPCHHLPVLLYADAIGHVDHFGHRVPVALIVDITDRIDLKESMLAAHESQRAWLLAQHGEDDYLGWMRRCGRDRARDFDHPACAYAEGFVQHLGHGFPKDDILTQALGVARVKRVGQG